MFDTTQEPALSNPIAPQLVGHDHTRHILQTFQEAPEEALGGCAVPPILHKDIQYHAVTIYSAPQVALHALDRDEYLIEMLFVAWAGPATTHAIGEALSELDAPTAHRLV